MQDPKTMTIEQLRGALDDCASTIKLHAEFLFHGMPHNIIRYVEEAEACWAEINRRGREEIEARMKQQDLARAKFLRKALETDKLAGEEWARVMDEIKRLEK